MTTMVSPSPTPSASSSSSITELSKSSSSPSPTPTPRSTKIVSTPSTTPSSTPKSVKRRSAYQPGHNRNQSVIVPTWTEIMSKHPIYAEYKSVKDRLASCVNSLRVPGGHGLLHYDEHICLTSEKDDFALLLVRVVKFPYSATRMQIYEAEDELKRRMLRKGTQLAIVLVDREGS